ncbi:MAG TPA: aminodeoxychorismate/anthranilate synthase component II [Lacipirellulaceae bacterium]|nr:aminodeoxychorismate/anthranilate synthase component II [Lacipirellulaceae bacterium]
MLLLIDNYDSFVHNLARHFERLGQATVVARNDAVDVPAVREMRPDAIVISPGPCTPSEAGVSLDLVRELHATVPILGVCLGHQVITEALGGRVVRAPAPVHGQASVIEHCGTGLFDGLPSPMRVGRYHSLVAESTSLIEPLRPTAWTGDGVVMALEHAALPVFGVQFHPESILTEGGYRLLANFLAIAGMACDVDVSGLEFSERPYKKGGRARVAANAAQNGPVPVRRTPVTF